MEHIKTRSDALKFLKSLDAPSALVLHAEIVSEVAGQIVDCLSNYEGLFNKTDIFVGAVLHDVGKTKHPTELYEEGHQHEEVGYQFLLKHGFSEKIGEISLLHSRWEEAKSLDPLIVALADKIWKGKRVLELEEAVITFIAHESKNDYWLIYAELTSCLDRIADKATERLLKTAVE
jgi:putative nucleotidyltransferase with HDIG domain